MLYFCTVIQFIANKEISLFVVNLNDGAAFTRLIIRMTIKITGFGFRNFTRNLSYPNNSTTI